MKSLVLALVVLFSAQCYGQSWRSPLDKWTNEASSKPLAELRTNPYDPKSLSNPYGAGSPYKVDGLRNPYSRYGSPYSIQSATNPYATRPPKIYGSDGKYLGELSANPYAPDSVSNPYGRYGSPYSPDSINNESSRYGRYSHRPIYVYPGGR